jgi:hypothetical protein
MPGLFLPRSRPWLWATAAEGGLEPAPVSRFRGASPHRISSYALLGLGLSRSWRTMVGNSYLGITSGVARNPPRTQKSSGSCVRTVRELS